MNSKMYRISKCEKLKINCDENYLTNTRFNLKATFLQEKKKKAVINDTSWDNVFQKTGSDFFPADNFSHIITHFGLMLYNTQERISTFADPVLYNLQL